MMRGVGFLVIIAVVALAAYGAITLYDETMQMGRMWETPAVRPHETPAPVMAVGSVPIGGGENQYRHADPLALHPPFALDAPAVIDLGRQGYGYFCVQCHGQAYDGMGTVGQSFAPLPGDLRSLKVQAMAPGQLFHEISFGIPNGRQPALAATISVDQRWQIIGFVKSLGVRP